MATSQRKNSPGGITVMEEMNITNPGYRVLYQSVLEPRIRVTAASRVIGGVSGVRFASDPGIIRPPLTT